MQCNTLCVSTHCTRWVIVCVFVFVTPQGQRKICSTMLPALPSAIDPSSQIIPCRCATQTYTKEKVLSRKMLKRTWLTSSWRLKSVRYREVFLINCLTNIVCYAFLILSLSNYSNQFFFPLHVLFLYAHFVRVVFCSVVSSVWDSGGHGAPLGHRGSGHWTENTHLWHDIEHLPTRDLPQVPWIHGSVDACRTVSQFRRHSLRLKYLLTFGNYKHSNKHLWIKARWVLTAVFICHDLFVCFLYRFWREAGSADHNARQHGGWPANPGIY